MPAHCVWHQRRPPPRAKPDASVMFAVPAPAAVPAAPVPRMPALMVIAVAVVIARTVVIARAVVVARPVIDRCRLGVVTAAVIGARLDQTAGQGECCERQRRNGSRFLKCFMHRHLLAPQ